MKLNIFPPIAIIIFLSAGCRNTSQGKDYLCSSIENAIKKTDIARALRDLPLNYVKK